MKAALLLFCALSASVNGQKEEDLTRSEIVRIWDHRTSDLHARPIEITDPKLVAELVSSINSAPGEWQQGSFTMPTGYLMIGFWRGSHAIARIGLGKRFLVRGSMEHWEWKKISKELEVRLSALAQNKQPNLAAGSR